jgi:DNA-directed RNA polymerase I subunit RPA49
VRFYPYSKPDSASSKKRRQKSQGQPKDLLLHSTSHRTLDYTAREDKPKSGDSLLKHYIGIFDPQSGKLDIIEAKKMVVRGVVRSRQAEDEAMAEQTVKYVSHHDLFRLCFGSSDIVCRITTR